MRWHTTAILAAVLIALGAFYYVYEIRLGPEREKAETRKGRVFTAEPGDVTRAELKRGDEVVRLTRDGEAWQMESPVKARGDRGPINDVLTTIVTAKMDREIASAPASLADFGLDKPAADVTLTLKDGKRLTLLLGAKNPTGVWVYAKERDKPSVFVLPEGVLRDATRAVAELRDKTILAFNRADVTGFEVTTRDETLAVEPAEGSRWKLTRPVQLAADADTVGEFLEKLGAAKVKEFVADSPASLTSYGLDQPIRLQLFTGKDKDRVARALLFGRPDEAKKGVYAMRPGESTVLLLPEDVWNALPRNVAILRNKVVAEFDRDKLTRLEVDGPRGRVALVRENDRWKITAPEALAADQVEVGAVLSKLRELKAQGFLGEDAAAVSRYLAKPEVRVTWQAQGEAAPTTLLLASSRETRGGRPSAYAAVAGRGPVVLVEATALTDLGRSADDLRDRTLLSGFEPRDVQKVQVKAGGKVLVLERKSETEWRMVEPAKGGAKGARVEDLLYSLRGLKWKEIAAPGGAEPARFGLDAPTTEVTLYKKDGSEVASLAAGKREADRVYVRTRSGPAVYAVDPKRLGEVPKIPDDFKE